MPPGGAHTRDLVREAEMDAGQNRGSQGGIVDTAMIQRRTALTAVHHNGGSAVEAGGGKYL